MKWGAPIIVLFSCLLLVSCSKSSLPKINDPEVLHKDCASLCQQFDDIHTNLPGFGLIVMERTVPEEKWTRAIKALNPLEVERGKWGISIWFGGKAAGYYVFLDPTIPMPTKPVSSKEEAMHSFEDTYSFKRTNMSGIYEVQLTVTAID